MRFSLRFVAIVLCFLSAAVSTAADDQVEPASSNAEIAEVVDRDIDLHLQNAGVTPAAQADDANLLRRTMLDLVGRIPTAAEANAFVSSSDSGKRVAMIDRLIASPGFARHQANELNAMLMPGNSGDLLKYLRGAAAENRPWDQIFRDLLAADP